MKRLTIALFAVLTFGCVKAPEIVVVDRATALEEQAAGSFDDLEKDLASRAIAPQPVPLTPEQLEALGIKPTPLVDETHDTDADNVDSLLRQRCVGEGNDGLLADTHDDCEGAASEAGAVELIDRSNRARMQLWRWMQTQRPELSLDEVRQAWRVAHARGVVCNGWMQRDDGQWEAKKC
jgi:hypothetical protein